MRSVIWNDSTSVSSRLYKSLAAIGVALCFSCATFPGERERTDDTALEQTLQNVADSHLAHPDDEVPTLQVCHSAPPPEPIRSTDWSGTGSRITTAAMSPHHAASDLLVTPQSEVVLEARFNYGAIRKDLEHEEVEIWYDDCSGEFQKLVTLETDDEGWVYYRWPSSELPAYGMYQLYFRVVADNSHATAVLRLLPVGTKLAVFDIDGTLTTSNQELFRDWIADATRIFGVSDYVPNAREQAAEITHFLAWEAGYILVYLTGRFYWMRDRTQAWLTTLDFAPGHLRLTPGWSEWRPTNDGVGTFKSEYLDTLRDTGFQISYMYGNASTDAWAYERIGGDTDRIFMFGHDVESEDIVDLGDDYGAHLMELKMTKTVPIEQPFSYPPSTLNDDE